MPDAPRRRGALPASVAGGALLGAGVGLLGTAVHLDVAPLPSGLAPSGWTLPWGVILALALAGSTQRWWMHRTAARGVRPVAAGGAVVIAAFTAALALCRLPGTDRLDLPWSPAALAALPGAAAASVAWLVGLPLVGVAVLVAGAREARREARRAVDHTPGRPVGEGPIRPRHAAERP